MTFVDNNRDEHGQAILHLPNKKMEIVWVYMGEEETDFYQVLNYFYYTSSYNLFLECPMT